MERKLIEITLLRMEISLRVETHKGIKDLSLNSWILGSLRNLGESLSLR